MVFRIPKIALVTMLSAVLVGCGSTDTTSQERVVDQMPTTDSSVQKVVASPIL